MSEESPLAPPTADEPAAEAPARTGPSFGNLRPNKKARGRRCQKKFFDSAEWARGQVGDQQDGGSAPPNLVPFTVADGTTTAEGESPLASASPMSQ